MDYNRIREKIIHQKPIYVTTEERHEQENIVVSKKRPQRLLINNFRKSEIRLLQLQTKDERMLKITVGRVQLEQDSIDFARSQTLFPT